MPDVQNINLSKIIKRLELIKSLISLEEEEIDGHVFKLEQFGTIPENEKFGYINKEGIQYWED